MPRLFFATDIHGSDICWKKFLNAAKFYQAEALILGGDMTGKALVPILQETDGTYSATLLQQKFKLNTEAEVFEMERKISSRGYYPFRTTGDQLKTFEADPQKLDAFFHEQMLKVLEQWLLLADERLRDTNVRCFVCPGNDDSSDTDDLIRRAHYVHLAEGKVVELGDGFSMISTGWSNITPWKTFRELPEDQLAAKIESMIPQQMTMSKTIFNFHCPPYGSGLDEAPEIDSNLHIKNAGQSLVPVGSIAVRNAILKYQPLISLHGHIHEGKGSTRLKKTLVINAGSAYEQGVLQGALIDLDAKKGIKNYTLTTG